MNRRFRPTESKTFLLNPHKGCATFQRFNGDPLYPGKIWSESGPTEFPAANCDTVEHYLPCTIAYCRWFWDLIQPEPDRFHWEPIERALETAHARGQTLQVRLMPHGSHNQPQLPHWYQERYPTGENTKKQQSYVTAVYDGPEFIDQWGNLILAFGERFDGHPDLESVDMSYIGPWGEGAGDCSEEAIDRITGIYRRAHPCTPLITMISGHKMTAGIRAGAGWRCDCFGDLGIWYNPRAHDEYQWNHMFDCYPREVCECGAQEVWQTAPVVFETCSVPMTWYEKGFDINMILQQGLKYHGSVFMPKSSALPEAWMPQLSDFCNNLGYRFVLRQFQHVSRVKQGEGLEYGCWIENVGVAPIYRRYPFAVRLTQGSREAILQSEADILKWLPGDVFVHESVAIPEGFEPGEIRLSTGVLDPETCVPKVRFAVEESDPQGWVDVGSLEYVTFS